MEIHWQSMFEDKPSSSASGSPEPISCFELCQPECMARNLGLCFFWKDEIMKDYIIDGTMRDVTILSVKLFINLIKEIPVFSPGLVGKCYMDCGFLFPCACCPSQGKRNTGGRAAITWALNTFVIRLLVQTLCVTELVPLPSWFHLKYSNMLSSEEKQKYC